MANKIATEKEAATIGGGTSYTANLGVTKVRAIALGCTIRLTTYTDNLLVALKDLMKLISTSCNCNSSKCSCYGYNAGCSGQCYSDTACSCNSSKCSCYGYVAVICPSDTTCKCVTACPTYKPASCGCNYVTIESNCTCHPSKCQCNTFNVCPSACTEYYCDCFGVYNSGSCTGVCYSVSGACPGYCPSLCNCLSQQLCGCYSVCNSNISCTCVLEKVCECNSTHCGKYQAGTAGCSQCYSHKECPCNSSKCSCYGYNAGCDELCYSHNSCGCNTQCSNDCSTNYG